MTLYLTEAIEQYAGRDNLISGIDYVLQDDGNGTYLKYWGVQDIAQPTIEQLIIISDQIAPLLELREKIDEALLLNQVNYDSRRRGTKVINGVCINIDPTSCINITGMVLNIMVNRAVGGTPMTIVWYDDNNVGITYTEDEFIALSKEVATTINSIQSKLSNNITVIQNATSVEDISNIDMDYSLL